MSLYAFSLLETFLDKAGYAKVPSVSFQVIRKNLVQGIQTGDIQVRKEGIFCTIDGYEHPGYIFNQKPDIAKFKEPRFHIADCEIIGRKGSLHGDYIWTNTEKVQLYDRGQGGRAYPAEGKLTTLKLCSKCIQIVDNAIGQLTATDTFYQHLTEQYAASVQSAPVMLDIYGYTLDWKPISRRYRQAKQFTCEQCKRDLSAASKRRFLHVHHINGIKTENRPQNLQCLCIRCHALVDARHAGNFDRPNMKRELDTFNTLFPM